MSRLNPDTVTVADLSLELSRQHSVSSEKPSIPGYELAEVLGRGAFGTAYKALQQSTGQLVAVKVLSLVSEGFRDEVSRLSLVTDHPHIVTLMDANLEFDPPYLVTPYFPGSLRSKILAPREVIDIDEVCRWFEEVAQALQFIHARGILHCDLKPANILLDGEGRARLVDFGQSVTLEGGEFRLGSFWYMPWQQACLPEEGAEMPSVTWDIYALGATVYHLLTAQLPRATDAAVKELRNITDGKEKLARYRQLAQDGVLRDIRSINPRVDQELAAIVEACLRQDQAHYNNVSEVRQDLDKRRRQQPVSALPQTASYWFKSFVLRNKVTVAVAGLATILLLGGLGYASVQVVQARLARQAVIRQQYERGHSLLEKGRASGLVWLGKAYQDSGNREYLQSAQEALARQLQVADSRLYKIQPLTAPSPSGKWAIWKDPADPGAERKLLDLSTGETSPLPKEILSLNLNQKDTVRYRLDGVILDARAGGGGPATWRLPPSDSIAPGAQDPVLALLVRPDQTWSIERLGSGFGVYSASRELLLSITSSDFALAAPTFSLNGDIVVGWEAGSVVLWSRENSWSKRILDEDFRGELFCFSPDSQVLAGHDGESRIRVWKRSGEVIADFEVDTSANELCFDPEGNLLVAVTRDGLVHGWELESGQSAWAPAELEKAARWVFVQQNGQIVTCSDEITVWKRPQANKEKTSPLGLAISRRTGWVYDDTARVRTLSREEYSKLKN